MAQTSPSSIGASGLVFSNIGAGKTVDTPAGLHAHPKELPHPRRQVEAGHGFGHVEQLQAKERHHVADDDSDQEHLGRKAQGCARGDLGSEEGGDPVPVPLEHAAALAEVPQGSPRQPARLRGSADNEIDQARDHGREEERVEPPIF
jgi:hypothetical protein